MDEFINVTAFTILAAVWLASAIALVASRSSLDATWRGVGALLLGRIMGGRERKLLGAIKERFERGAPTNGGGQQ